MVLTIYPRTHKHTPLRRERLWKDLSERFYIWSPMSTVSGMPMAAVNTVCRNRLSLIIPWMVNKCVENQLHDDVPAGVQGQHESAGECLCSEEEPSCSACCLQPAFLPLPSASPPRVLEGNRFFRQIVCLSKHLCFPGCIIKSEHLAWLLFSAVTIAMTRRHTGKW